MNFLLLQIVNRPISFCIYTNSPAKINNLSINFKWKLICASHKKYERYFNLFILLAALYMEMEVEHTQYQGNWYSEIINHILKYLDMLVE